MIAILLVTGIMAQEEKTFTVNGTINGFSKPVARILYFYRKGDKNITDSVEVKDGTYQFSGTVAEPLMLTLRVRYPLGADGKPVKVFSQGDYAPVFIGPGTIKVSSADSLSNITVSGSAANDEYKKLTALLKPVNEQMRAESAIYSKAAKEKNESARKASEEKLDSLDKVTRELNGQYVKNNSRSPIAHYALVNYAGWEIDPVAVEPLLNQLSPEQKQYPSIKMLTANLEIAKKTAVGAMAMDFTQNDTVGKPVSLSSLRGKYLLVDFWASWCGPCRRENPNVVKAYQAYRDKGFHIISVSLDQPGAKDKWIKAIHDDNLTWTHVSDLQYWNNEVAKQYGIQAIPQNLLLDPKGKIIAKNLTGDQLEKKLSEILKP